MALYTSGISIILLYTTVCLLHFVLPGSFVFGYACKDNGDILKYKLNGLLVALIILSILVCKFPMDIKQIFFEKYWSNFLCVNIIGISLSFYFYVKEFIKPKFIRCLTVDQLIKSSIITKAHVNNEYRTIHTDYQEKNNAIKECVLVNVTASISNNNSRTRTNNWEQFFLGHEWNPRLFENYGPFYTIDIKMLLYLIGAIGLGCNIVSGFYVSHEYRVSYFNELQAGVECSNISANDANADMIDSCIFDYASNAMYVYCACFSWFLLEYLYFEEIHLYTYDIFAEKIGFKLIWGCLVFYPFVYCIGMYPIVIASPELDLSFLSSVAICLLYLLGWCLTRGANMQKYYSRKYPYSTTCFMGAISQHKLSNTHILISGFWGVSRHLNYMGEIIQGIALALPGFLVCLEVNKVINLENSLWYYIPECVVRYIPWLYPLYYVALFIPRQLDDDIVCQNKYGQLWNEYTALVPYKIFPGIW